MPTSEPERSWESEEPARPEFHLTAAGGWVNDPLGLTFHDGRYHLFFQHVPAVTAWAPSCSWGHATSSDLVVWSERPVALAPGGGDDGCWSGSIAIAEAGEPVLFYTSVRAPDYDVGSVRVARPADPAWDTWVKQDVVAQAPSDVDAVAFRDPYVYRDGTRWRMLMGAGLAGGVGAALVYVSDDLLSWDYDGVLASRANRGSEPVWTGSVWECPQLFGLDDEDVLVVSVSDADVLHYVACAVGEHHDGRFTPHRWHRLTYGPCYYAASTFTDEHRRRGLVLWLQGVSDRSGVWTGALSLPHLLRLEGTRVIAEPHPNLAAYRGAAPADDRTFAVAADIEWAPAAEGSVLRLRTRSGRVVAEIRAGGDALTLSAATGPQPWTMPSDLGPVRLVLDGPILELFAATGVLAMPVDASGGPLAPQCSPADQLRWWTLSRSSPTAPSTRPELSAG